MRKRSSGTIVTAGVPDDGGQAAGEVSCAMPLRVVLADDGALFRQALADLLGRAGIQVLAQAGNVPLLLRAVEEHQPDLDELTGALTRISDGGTVFDPKLVVELLGRARRADPLDALTSREREVLKLMAETANVIDKLLDRDLKPAAPRPEPREPLTAPSPAGRPASPSRRRCHRCWHRPLPGRRPGSVGAGCDGSSTARADPCDTFLHGFTNWRQPPGRVVWPTSIRYPSGSRM